MNFAHHKSRAAQSPHRDLNIDPLVSRLVLGKMASMHEMQTIYCYEDLLDLNEILSLREEAQYLAEKKANGTNRR